VALSKGVGPTFYIVMKSDLSIHYHQLMF